jgi:hypothetical protein
MRSVAIDDDAPTDVLRIGVVTDWSRNARANLWPELLGRLNRSIPHELTAYPLADQMDHSVPAVQRVAAEHRYTVRRDLRLEYGRGCHVLIVNWDAVNGDPIYGADLAQRWFDHHRPEVMLFVRSGGLLIVEGQAKYHVPVQQAYDAVFGRSELVVSRTDDPLQPDLAWNRTGDLCRIASAAREIPSFQAPPDRLEPNIKSTFQRLFPGFTHSLFAPGYEESGRWAFLYRGWFRSALVGRSNLKWVPLAKVGDRRRKWDVARIAKHGKGAVVATTMMLASSDQRGFVEAILKLHGDVEAIPEPRGIVVQFRRHLRDILRSLALALTVALLVPGVVPGALGDGVVSTEVTRAVIVLLAVLVYLIAASLVRRLGVGSLLREIFIG